MKYFGTLLVSGCLLLILIVTPLLSNQSTHEHSGVADATPPTGFGRFGPTPQGNSGGRGT